MVGEAPGGRDDDMRAGCERQGLCAHVCAADEEADFKILWRADSSKLFGDLEGEFTRGREDEREDAKWVFGPFLEDRGGEGDGFSRTGTRATNAVFAWGEIRYGVLKVSEVGEGWRYLQGWV